MSFKIFLQQDSDKFNMTMSNITIREETEKCLNLQMEHKYGIDENGNFHSKRNHRRMRCPVYRNYKAMKYLCCAERKCRFYLPRSC